MRCDRLAEAVNVWGARRGRERGQARRPLRNSSWNWTSPLGPSCAPPVASPSGLCVLALGCRDQSRPLVAPRRRTASTGWRGERVARARRDRGRQGRAVSRRLPRSGAMGLVDAVVTSPPYDGLREYGGIDQSDWLDVISLIAASLGNGGVCMWNVADQTVDGLGDGDIVPAVPPRHRLRPAHSRYDDLPQAKASPSRTPTDTTLRTNICSCGARGRATLQRDQRLWNKWRGSATNGTCRQPDGTTGPISGTGR